MIILIDKMATIAVLCAMDRELEKFIENFNAQRIGEEKIYKTQIGNNTVVCAVCGIGKVNSAMMTQRLIDRYSPDAVINCGVAGGLDKSLAVLDTVIVERAQYHDFHPLSLLEEDENIKASVFECDRELVSLALDVCSELHGKNKIGNYISGKVVSGDCFVESDEVSRRLREELGGSCVEMEGASIAHAAYLSHIPFVIIRAISDKADDSAEMDYPTFERAAAKHSANLVAHMICKL